MEDFTNIIEFRKTSTNNPNDPKNADVRPILQDKLADVLVTTIDNEMMITNFNPNNSVTVSPIPKKVDPNYHIIYNGVT